MIAKKYRLTEKEIKKVLSQRKPFFANGIVANILPNTLGYARIAMILKGKQAPGSVNRNYFRRRTYDLSYPFLIGLSYDIVFVMKKGKILNYKEEAHFQDMKRDIAFLYKIIAKNSPRKVRNIL